MKTGPGRKFIQAAVAEVAMVVGLAVCMLTDPAAGLRQYIPYFVGAIVTVAIGYGVANAWQARALGPSSDNPDVM